MDSMGTKKLALLYILDILKEHSNFEHPLKQEDIAAFLERDYGIVIERKAVGRNVGLLREAGYMIEGTKHGVYLDEREFEVSELRLVIDSVLAGRYLTAAQSKSIIERLQKLSDPFAKTSFRHVAVLNDYDKTDNRTVFYTVELVDTAIETQKQLRFEYYHLDETFKLRFDREHTVTPIQMVVKNQQYYLIAIETHMVGANGSIPRARVELFRMDLISNPVMTEENAVDIRTVRGYENGFDYRDFLSAHPFMKTGARGAQTVVFWCYKQNLNLLIDAVGKNIKVRPVMHKASDGGSLDRYEGLCEVTVKMEVNNAIELACRYPNELFLRSPESAKQRVKTLFESAVRIQEMFDEDNS